jgi:hypothetical protein
MAQLPFSINFIKGTTANIIEIGGSLVINHIEKIYSDLSRNIDLTKNLKLVVNEVESIDITFVQLLLGLKKEYAISGNELTIDCHLSDESWALLNNAGFNKQLIN